MNNEYYVSNSKDNSPNDLLGKEFVYIALLQSIIGGCVLYIMDAVQSECFVSLNKSLFIERYVLFYFDNTKYNIFICRKHLSIFIVLYFIINIITIIVLFRANWSNLTKTDSIIHYLFCIVLSLFCYFHGFFAPAKIDSLNIINACLICFSASLFAWMSGIVVGNTVLIVKKRRIHSHGK